MNGAPLALGLAAFVALASGVRRGSRSKDERREYRVEFIFDPSGFSGSRELIKQDPVLLRVSVAGRSVNVRPSCVNYWLENQIVEEWTPKDLYRAVVSFSRWLESLSFPLTLYRGLRAQRALLRMPRHGEQVGETHEHWTTNLDTARQFASGVHPGGGRRAAGEVGVVLAGVRGRPVADISYLLDDWLRFTDNPSYAVTPEYEYGEPDPGTLVVLQQVSEA